MPRHRGTYIKVSDQQVMLICISMFTIPLVLPSSLHYLSWIHVH